MSNISLISLFFKISLIQSILCKSSFNLLLSNLSKFLLYTLVLGSGFGVMKSSRITNWSNYSEIECKMLPDKVVNSKLLKKILLSRAFDLSVTLEGCRTRDVKKSGHIVL